MQEGETLLEHEVVVLMVVLMVVEWEQ